MSKIEKSTKMMGLLNYRLRVTIRDGRIMIGQLLAFDRHMNLVLADCEEFRKLKIKDAKEGERQFREEKRVLGLVVLRGDLVINFTIEAPPPGPKQEKKPGMSGMPVPGPGIARPAGRGMPIPPVAAGLVGPGRIGGPAMPPIFPGGGGGPAFPGNAMLPTGLPPMPPGWRPGMPLPPMPPGFRPPSSFPGARPPPHLTPMPPGFRLPFSFSGTLPPPGSR